MRYVVRNCSYCEEYVNEGKVIVSQPGAGVKGFARVLCGCCKGGWDVRGRRRKQAALGRLLRGTAQRRIFEAGVGPCQAAMQQM